MSAIAARRLKWALFIAIPVLLLAAMLPGVRARRQYAATQALLVECQSQRRFEKIEQLIAQGADVNGRCLADCPPSYMGNGAPPLQLSIMGSAPNALPPMKLLLDAGADINGRDNNGQTALMVAANSPSPEVVQFLIEHGAGVNLHTDPMKFPNSPVWKTMSALDFVNRTSSPKFQRGFADVMPLSKLNRIKQMLTDAGAQLQKPKP